MVERVGFGELGDRLRGARARAGMTRRQLATLSGTSERYLANLESGAGNPSLGVLTNLSRALDLALADLLPAGAERTAAHAEAAAIVRGLPEARIPALLDWIRSPVDADISRGRRIVLIGMRGAGKSSLGTALARRLGLTFLEMSKEVERAYGGEMRLLLELGGQDALRRYEHEAWENILRRNEAAVIATPGGIVADPDLFDRVLATAHSIWLEASPEDHLGRVMAQGDFRPMANNSAAMEDLKAILSARTADYARAEARLDTSVGDFEAALAALEGVARSLGPTLAAL